MSDETLLLVFDVFFSVFGYQMTHFFSGLMYYLSVFRYLMKLSLSLVFDILLLDVWISDDTLLLVIDIFVSVFRHLRTHHSCSCLINYFSVFGYQIKHSSCLIHYFSVLRYQIKHSSCLIYYFSVLGYQIKHSSRLIYYFLTFGYQMKHSPCLIYCFSLFGYLMKHFSCLIHYFSVLEYQLKHSSCFSDISHLVVWISH